jgi:hypothetical protein
MAVADGESPRLIASYQGDALTAVTESSDQVDKVALKRWGLGARGRGLVAGCWRLAAGSWRLIVGAADYGRNG